MQTWIYAPNGETQIIDLEEGEGPPPGWFLEPQVEMGPDHPAFAPRGGIVMSEPDTLENVARRLRILEQRFDASLNSSTGALPSQPVGMAPPAPQVVSASDKPAEQQPPQAGEAPADDGGGLKPVKQRYKSPEADYSDEEMEERNMLRLRARELGVRVEARFTTERMREVVAKAIAEQPEGTLDDNLDAAEGT